MPRIKERQSPQGQVHAVALALRILELLAINAKPTRVTDLAGKLGTSKNRIHRHLQTLVEAGYAVRDVDTQRYMPGIRLLQLGNAVANQYDLVTVSRPVMRRLRDGLGVAVVVSKVVGHQIFAVEHMLSPSSDAVWVFIGTHLELHSSAQGKLVLAFSSPELLDTVSKAKLTAHTGQTIVDARRLQHEIAKVRRQGWAGSFGERQVGVNSIAAPIFNAADELFATVALVGLANELKKESMPALVEQLRGSAKEISGALFDTNLARRKVATGFPVRADG